MIEIATILDKLGEEMKFSGSGLDIAEGEVVMHVLKNNGSNLDNLMLRHLLNAVKKFDEFAKFIPGIDYELWNDVFTVYDSQLFRMIQSSRSS